MTKGTTKITRILLFAAAIGFVAAGVRATASPAPKAASPAQKAASPTSTPAGVTSPDKRWFAYIVEDPKVMVDTARGEAPASTIFIRDNKDKTVRVVAKSGDNREFGKTFAGMDLAAFSPDSRRLYFLNAEYAVSSHLYAYDPAVGRLSRITDGHGLSFLTTGKWKGDLLVLKRRYTDTGPDEAWWVVTPSGKVLARHHGQD